MTPRILITGARILTPAGPIRRGWLLLDRERIIGIGAGAPPAPDGAETLDATGLVAMPGFIDPHVHGGVGVECMDGDPESLRRMARFFARHGVTAFLPTTWTAPRDRILRALRTVAAGVGPQPDGATILGAYLEGPYLNPDRAGAQDPREIRRADRVEAMQFLDLGVVRVLALAPEYDENLWLIEECARRGIVVSAAHTAASYDQMVRAVALGLSQTTHTYNAMTGLHHRTPGSLGAALAIDALRCEIIADNEHVHPAAQKILVAAKGLDRVIAITDAVRGAGMPDGATYVQDGRPVVVRGGASYLLDGTLAGSGLTMDRALGNLIAATGRRLEELWPLLSLNAARSLGIADRKGSLAVGRDADVVLVDDALGVRATIAMGRVVYQDQYTGTNSK